MTNTHLSEQRAGQTCFARSYAKINLTLDVLRRRSDGFHELLTIMQTIDLYDTICVTAIAEDAVRLTCSRPELNGDDNLVVRAIQALRQRLALPYGFEVELYKQIPVAAGLGGGSSNAATVLTLLQRAWQLPISAEELHEIAAALGSDVPFFLEGGLAYCEGRGEVITPLTPHWPASMRWLLLLKPAISVSTASVFRNLTPDDYCDGSWSRKLRTALEQQTPVRPEDLHNSLQRGVLEQYPEVARAREEMLRAGAPHVYLSGSGPTLFTAFTTLDPAVRVQHQLREAGYEVYLTRAIHPQHEDISFFSS
ncbi:4-diphosphocytidyl-2-C-methyl-D-erythritol kinase [Thermosporothrix hazakensis]|jgi:4-diphosphocytidyl-2-C-methyl-D-erythritol kinase|uniref:4-diphosphocytidyl-2-C-methyl-D-erythritol kinase n=1 Tax=Thermosporothrix hazakensis TaxID=644383 RepID=A0A326UDT9_THEHA|nr:4-(cytidine 5'-diphospho)-2-C-methyl-D-erythritol kinase [Thermosporothrix hazakensis]PZW36456.1 4-diphosphocytidyl-2-C-methyl-D-erythritol kinase [Thermosporothrix hazakensis]GCE47110.1 4-diphosphocytidyl-2-C-methyl-D-erythritol kinase [Thermosporothrix hazakensis]